MNNKQEHEKFERQRWSKYAKDPDAWLCCAKDLKSAADILRNNGWPKNNVYHNHDVAGKDCCYGPVYMLISGLAIETLIKGIMIANKPNLVEQQRLSKKISKHNIVELFQEINIRERKVRKNFNEDLLKRLQNYIETFGRYPVTKNQEGMAKKANTHFCRVDFGKVDRLWKLLLKHYTKEQKI